MHGGEALVRITVQGRSPSDAVLHALHVRVVDRAAPLPWNAYRMDNGCGGAVTPRHFAVDLDRPRPLARPVDGLDASGAEVRKIPAVSFPRDQGEAGVRARLRRRALDHRLGLWTDRVTDE
ncbi:hypothetical protein ASD51_31880 [Streptomyces sp. Root55]|uniref:hypothetical protein n=1 Tax=Streptomyces sp. Root55 TaxID=1736554 RepID=UPI0006F9D63D|nr:hypothetical protein [Streptomyces sp. Root55]KQZ16533.1 hypothetical protein ASD51_31880 [Streptomyces sp. Root55]